MILNNINPQQFTKKIIKGGLKIILRKRIILDRNSFVYYPITYRLRFERKYINKRHYSTSNFSR